MNSAPLKVSYCTTCRGRLPHLKQTLPANLAAEKDNPNVEFVVLDYGDEGKDGNLGEWIKQTFPEELASGRLRYARYEAPHFAMAHAKNMAHRLATGDIVCNVDADNFIAPNFSPWLTQQFAYDRHAVVSVQMTKVADDLAHKFKRLVGRPASTIGSIGGRLAIRRDDFERLGGYHEKYSAWGEEDVNLVLRARQAGLDMVKLPEALIGGAIQHGNDKRIENLNAKDKAVSTERLGRQRLKNIYYQYYRLLGRPEPVANAGANFGCGEVVINFEDHATHLGPVTATTVDPALFADSVAAPARRTNWVATQVKPDTTSTISALHR